MFNNQLRLSKQVVFRVAIKWFQQIAGPVAKEVAKSFSFIEVVFNQFFPFLFIGRRVLIGPVVIRPVGSNIAFAPAVLKNIELGNSNVPEELIKGIGQFVRFRLNLS